MSSSFSIILPFIRALEPLIKDPTITEIMVNRGGREVYVERNGIPELTTHTLGEKNLMVAIKNIARHCGDDISEEQPRLHARLEDGSRIAAMFRPCSPDGPTLTIRKFTRRFTLQELVSVGSLSTDIASILHCAVLDEKNILISGGTGVGKTVLLNALANTITGTSRIVLIEETSEIHIPPPHHVVRFEARRKQVPLGAETPVEAVTLDDLLRDSLRHRPDRIILGEVRGPEAWALIQSLNTGHAGSLSTVHANNALQALKRLSHLVLTANTGLPHEAINETIALAINIVVHLSRVDGHRRVVEVLEVADYHDSAFVTRQIYSRVSRCDCGQQGNPDMECHAPDCEAQINA